MKAQQGKVALVTGGSSGIGQAIAIRLGADGASVAINYVGRSEGAVSTKEAIEHGVEMCIKQVAAAGGRPILIGADVSDERAVEQIFDRVMSEYGRLDILINNAGIQIAEDSHELSAADFDKVLAVNLRGAFLCARQAVRAFLAAERPGVIVNVSSVHQVIPKPRFLGYSVSKGGMQNLTRSLALEYAARGIRVNGIGPGATVTPINRSWIDDPVKRRMVESHIPMRRAGDSAEMAAAVAFLCSDEAAYITGQTLFIDGGLTLYPSFETTWSSELPGVPRAVPEEKEPVLLAQRPELPAGPGRQHRSGQDPLGIAPGQQRGHGKAQFIQQACRGELPVQAGAALREHAGVSAFGQGAQRGR
jgi:glucose 1-dehydrogenase